MIIYDATPHGALVSPDDDRFKRWIWRDHIMRELRKVQSGANDVAHLTTGIKADESQLLSLVAQMNGRAS